jgi:hypothetical protein
MEFTKAKGPFPTVSAMLGAERWDESGRRYFALFKKAALPAKKVTIHHTPLRIYSGILGIES